MNGDLITGALQGLNKFYRKCNFQITEILADGQFAVCKHELATLQVNFKCVYKDEHVHEVKCLIFTTKKRCTRCSFHNTPFKKLPRGLRIGLLKNIMFYLNTFPHKEGADQNLSPSTSVQGSLVDYNLLCKVAFRSYDAQTRNLVTTNNMHVHKTGAIAMGPTSTYFQGGVEFYSLELGKTLHRSKNDYTIASMPADVIACVIQLATD